MLQGNSGSGFGFSVLFVFSEHSAVEPVCDNEIKAKRHLDTSWLD